MFCVPEALEASTQEGKQVTLRLKVGNAGGQTLKWSVAAAPPWVTIVPRKGELGHEAQAELTITINAQRLKPGPVAVVLVIQAPGAIGSPLSIPLSVNVTAAPLVEAQPPETKQLQPKLIQPPVDSMTEPPPRRVTPVRQPTLGVRAGMLAPKDESLGGYDSGFAAGVFWRPNRNGSRLGYELALDFGQAESDFESSTLLRGQALALWHFARGKAYGAYALGGLSLLSEQVDDDQLGGTSNVGSTLDIGAGATFARRYDARVSVSLLLGSKNVDSVISAAFGVMF